ncbi:MAG TPA: hypothetical protein DIV86_05395, partial [Alphaproteobacteria bacterium]|nr:hypothetical protein [Alphaproteobacteria bacterium]
NHELHKGKYFSQIIRNKNLKCKDLPEGEATMFFIDEKLARINIFSTSEKLDLLVFAKSKFGETENQLNEDSSNNKNYADYWDKKNIIITYKNTLSPQNIWQENLVIELKKFSSELYESENVKE